MARLFVRHPVTDFSTWHVAYKNSFDFQKANGVTAEGVFQNTDDPKDVTVFHDFATVDEAKAFAANDELKAIMQNAGVAGPPTIWITEVA